MIITNENILNLNELEIKELLQLQAAITSELKDRDVVRTQNNPLGDYTEWLVAKAMGLELAANSKAGYDGIDSDGIRIQIKGRRITSKNKSRQLSAVRNYDKKDFDALAGVIFDENFDIIDAVLVPYETVGKYASYREHVNAHILFIKEPLLSDPTVKCIKNLISS